MREKVDMGFIESVLGLNNAEFIALLFVILAICLFVILREYLCWYWKVNHVVDLLEQINDKLGRLSGENKEGSVSSAGNEDEE